ncbi:hypothetical protein CPC08DRAFT_648406, partial [Agrocybe pediades]
QEWTGSMFARTTLKNLGLKLQLNHSGPHCDNPIPCHASLLILHTNGIHEVSLQYCGCTRAVPQHLQLLRRRLYPSTQIAVKTCATFDLLALLTTLSLTTKASTYDFYRTLERMTSNTGSHLPKTLRHPGIGPRLPNSRYRALSRMLVQWQHLKMLKWGGRGHAVTGVAGTKPGDLALQCPSCPRPGVNLPAEWEDAPETMRFLYVAILCMDANFRLKNQLVSNYSQDPGLGTGWSYMVPRRPYEGYVLSRADDRDISTCVGFQALAKANTKFSVGLRYTGVGMTTCGRSEMIMAQGVGNLQKGERYANMDYIFASTVHAMPALPLILISYDIACQWFTNIFGRMQEHWPTELRLPSTTRLIPAIPKLHEPMHQGTNHQMYSLNYIPGVGLSDCECPERVWGPHNALGNSTKTQGPGSRQDVLDFHFHFWNWAKYVGMGSTLLRRLSESVGEKNCAEWEKMCVTWEEDSHPKKVENPYHVKGLHISEAQVKKKLADEERERMEAGGVSLHSTSSWSFVALALELEDTQNMLRTRIRAWEQIVPVYLPGIVQYRANLAMQRLPPSSTPASSNPEDEDLWLPSRVPAAERDGICQHGLPSIEEKLRDAQLADSLDSLRRVLRIKSRMVQFKNKNVRGQRDGTRSRTMIDRVHERARACVEKYRQARRAKLALAGPGDWEKTYRVLEDADVRGFQDPARLQPRTGRLGVWEDDNVPDPTMANGSTSLDDRNLLLNTRDRRDGTGETRRTLSWIWLTGESHLGDDDTASEEILRAEWAKSRARSNRTKEEVMLLKEEMRRVLLSLEWKAQWWEARKDVGSESGKTIKDLAEGASAYATSQAQVQRSLATLFRKMWESPLQDEPHEKDAESDEDSDEEEDDNSENHDYFQDDTDGDNNNNNNERGENDSG